MKDFKERAEEFHSKMVSWILNSDEEDLGVNVQEVAKERLSILLQQVWEEGRVAGLEKAEELLRKFPSLPAADTIRALKEKK